MKPSKEIIDVVKNNKELFEVDDYKGIYAKYSYTVPVNKIKDLTNFLYDIDIDPLKYVDVIPYYFLGFSDIKEFIVPDNIRYISEGAFANSALESIMFSDSVKVIGAQCFKGCKNLKNINLGSIEEIGGYSFDGCVSLEEINIPNTVTYFGNNVFINCKNLKDIYYNGDKISWLKLNGNKPLMGDYYQNKSTKLKKVIIHCADDDIEWEPKNDSI